MPVASYIKDPQAKLEYYVDWSDWLEEGETIVNSEWFVDSGINKESSITDGSVTAVWLSGGVNHKKYSVTNRITTAERIDERSIQIICKHR